MGRFIVARVFVRGGILRVDFHPVGRKGAAGDPDYDEKGERVDCYAGDADVDDVEEARGDSRAVAHATVEEKDRDLGEARGEDVEELLCDGKFARLEELGECVVPDVVVFAVDVGSWVIG